MNAVAGQTVVTVVEACLVTTSIMVDNDVWLKTHAFQRNCTSICILSCFTVAVL